MRDKDAQLMMEALCFKEDGIDPDKHEYSGAKWMVQWTKNIKAKLAKAQEIGDSKEANKLQRFLDAHGVDEAYDSWIDDPVGDDNPHLKPDKSDPPAPSPAQNTAGYIQIDLNTGGIQTISPDEVEQATRGLEHIPAGEGTSDWDAWRGEEYMIVAVPKVVHWPETGAYQHQ